MEWSTVVVVSHVRRMVAGRPLSWRGPPYTLTHPSPPHHPIGRYHLQFPTNWRLGWAGRGLARWETGAVG